MRTLVAFSLLVAAVLAEPQYFYNGGVVPQVGYGSYGGYYAGVVPVAGSYLGASPVVSKSVYSPYVAPGVTPYVAHVAYPSQDTSRGIPQPVQDTPEVKHAKAVFAKQYETAAVNAALGTVPVHSIHKRAAVFASAVPYKTPASTSPLVYSAVASPVVGSQYAYNVAPYSGVYSTPYATPYSTPYGYGVAPYTSYY